MRGLKQLLAEYAMHRSLGRTALCWPFDQSTRLILLTLDRDALLMNPRPTIVVVDGDPRIRAALHQLIRAAGYNSVGFATAEEFLVTGPDSGIQCVIAAADLPGMSGIRLLAALAESGLQLPAVLMGTRDDVPGLDLAQTTGIVPCLHKPFSNHDLLEAIRTVMPG